MKVVIPGNNDDGEENGEPYRIGKLTIVGRIHSSSVSIVTRLWAGLTGFDFQQEGNFSFRCHVRTAFQWGPRVKGPGREADHSPPSRAQVKNA